MKDMSDMNAYFSGRMKKDEISAGLKASGSIYAALYQDAYPDIEDVPERWYALMQKAGPLNSAPSAEEAAAIVNWAFRALKTAKEREELARFLFAEDPQTAGVSLRSGVAYDEKRVDLHVFSPCQRSHTSSPRWTSARTPCFTADMPVRIISCSLRSCGTNACTATRAGCIMSC